MKRALGPAEMIREYEFGYPRTTSEMGMGSLVTATIANEIMWRVGYYQYPIHRAFYAMDTK